MRRDPIEQTEEFKKLIEKLQPELDAIDKEIEERDIGMGACHIYWAKKKELLRKHGVDWKSPKDMNPNIMFD